MKTFNEVANIVKEVFKNEAENINLEEKENTIIVNSYNNKTYVVSLDEGGGKWQADILVIEEDDDYEDDDIVYKIRKRINNI